MATTVVVTSKGREFIANRIHGALSEPLNVGWGSGGIGTGSPYTAAITDVNAFQESSEARVAGVATIVTTTSANDTYQVVGTITAAGTKTIAESLLSDVTTKPFTTTVAATGVPGSSSSTVLNTAASYTPANSTSVQIDTEVMLVTAGTGTTALTVTRGSNGSAAIATISIGDIVTLGNAPGTATANASMFAHASFTGLPLNLNDSIQFTWQIKISS